MLLNKSSVQNFFKYFLFLSLIIIVISGAFIFMMLCPSPTDGKSGWGELRFDSNGIPPSWKCFNGITNTTLQQWICTNTNSPNYEFYMEINSQILNGLFTIIAFINHPERLCELYLLLKGEDDIINLVFPQNENLTNYQRYI